MKNLLFAICATFILFSCKPIKEIQYIDRCHETIKYDSVYKYVKDTMTITNSITGDTTIINHWNTKIDYKYKYLNKTDTITKTLTQVKTEIKEKKVTSWIGWIDWGLLCAVIIYGIYRLLKFLKVIP